MEKNIRNFCIIAHIDHGKSTLADRFIERAKLVNERSAIQNQILDNMDIERERGITIKSQAVSIDYKASDSKFYTLNLVDTPGHADFSYEVSRAISSCEGAILLIDATQGVEAQTIANMYMAVEQGLEIIPVINKIDLKSADIDGTKKEIVNELGFKEDDILLVSAKTALGIEELFEAIVQRIPSPQDSDDKPLRALVYDSHYDSYKGVIVHIRVFDGIIRASDQINFLHGTGVYKVDEVGVFKLDLEKRDSLSSGEVGYVIASIKNISDVKVGDTITHSLNPCSEALEGFKDVKPVVFSSIYPVDTNDYEELLKAMERLKLNDASLSYEKDSSLSLGFGFRCGFLGLLHLEIIEERLERECNVAVVFTSPSVQYIVHLKDGTTLNVDNPTLFPNKTKIDYSEEPYIKAQIILPADYLGNIIALCIDKRGVQNAVNYLSEKRVELIYEMPLAEVLLDFYDKLKSYSHGYASFDYEIIGYRTTELEKMEVLVNGESVDALSELVYAPSARERGKLICKRLSQEIPRHQFKIPIQAVIGSQIIARETISAFRKDVTAKCYGGDISRKRKLLEKQKEGKKRMKMVGSVEIPQKAFLSVLKTSNEE